MIGYENKSEYSYVLFLSACGWPSIDHTKIAAFSSGRGPPSRLRRAHGFGRDEVSCRGFSAEGSFIVVRVFALPMIARSCGGSHILSLSLDDVYRLTFPVCFALPIFGRVRLPVWR